MHLGPACACHPNRKLFGFTHNFLFKAYLPRFVFTLKNELTLKKYKTLKLNALFFQTPDLSWRTPTIDATQLDTMLPLAPFRVPVDLLLNHYVNKKDGAGVLIINLKASKLKAKSKSAITETIDRTRILNSRIETVDDNDDADEVSS